MMIGIFGDSVARGVIYDEVKKKYIFLKDCFANRFSQKAEIPVKNYARFGCTITKGAEILGKHKAELSQFQYTALEFGGNDCDYNWSAVSEKPEFPHQPNVPLQAFGECYAKIIGQVREAGSKPVLLTLPPIDAERFFNWVSKGLSKENILKFLGDVQYIYRWHESYNCMILELAQKYKAPYINIRRDFLVCKNYKDLLCSDGMHPNEKGHALIDQCISRSLPAFL